mmetsp:Transcript_1459/g.3704  ORF Transcript_1459/g.3704 Transcript_1459/m.3704 type:complete len:104 (+) Transcript_1459:3703-4014(+)
MPEPQLGRYPQEFFTQPLQDFHKLHHSTPNSCTVFYRPYAHAKCVAILVHSFRSSNLLSSFVLSRILIMHIYMTEEEKITEQFCKWSSSKDHHYSFCYSQVYY